MPDINISDMLNLTAIELTSKKVPRDDQGLRGDLCRNPSLTLSSHVCNGGPTKKALRPPSLNQEMSDADAGTFPHNAHN